MDSRCLPISFWLVLAISDSGTGADTRPVIGIVGQKALLSSGLQVKPSNLEIVWEHVSSRTRILEYTKGNVKIYDTRYKERVDLHRNDFSLEILSLQTQDAGDYEVTVTLDTGAQNVSKVQLEVYEPVSGTQISVQHIDICNFTLTCSVTSGNPTSFRWWKGEDLEYNRTHHLRGRGETLEVHRTAGDRTIMYWCEARNPGSTEKAHIHLKDVCKQTTPATGLPWWVKMLIAIVIIIVIIIVIVMSLYIYYCCILKVNQLTWADLLVKWANWSQERRDQRVSFCTLLLNPETIIKNPHDNTDKQLDPVKVSEERIPFGVRSAQTPHDIETPAHRHPMTVDSSSQTPHESWLQLTDTPQELAPGQIPYESWLQLIDTP